MKRGMKNVLLYALCCVILVLNGCSSGSGGSRQDDGAAQDDLSLNLIALYSTVNAITVHVAYEPDAVPFTGTISDTSDISDWSILESNLNALFLGRDLEPEITVPKDLDNMEKIPSQTQQFWTTDMILDLAMSTWDISQSATSAHFYVLFVNGYFTSDGEVNRQVIGASYSWTPIVVIFKDVIASSPYSPSVDVFMEQATLVHEFGHAMGLVNIGVPMVSKHEDTEHPGHCTNEDCVMYWENDGSSLKNYIDKVIHTNSEVLFGGECLNDALDYQP
jgi:predicted Zn-dependent protease